MPPLGDRGTQRLADQRRDIGLAQAIGDRAFYHAAQLLLIERFEQGRGHARGTATQPARRFGRLRQPFARRTRDIHSAHALCDDARDQEIVAQETGERGGDAILVARDDRGVGDGEA